jgi:hypothetical protein
VEGKGGIVIDIRKAVAEYGVKNLRVFITDPEQHGFFRNPFGGRKEYCIVEERYKVEDNYKIGLRLVDEVKDRFAPDWFGAVLNERSFYICDFNIALERGSRIEVYVLVDEDNRYERLRECA